MKVTKDFVDATEDFHRSPIDDVDSVSYDDVTATTNIVEDASGENFIIAVSIASASSVVAVVLVVAVIMRVRRQRFILTHVYNCRLEEAWRRHCKWPQNSSTSCRSPLFVEYPEMQVDITGDVITKQLMRKNFLG